MRVIDCFKPQRGKFTRKISGAWCGVLTVSNPNGVNLHLDRLSSSKSGAGFKPQRGKFTLCFKYYIAGIGESFKPQRGKFTPSCKTQSPALSSVSNPNGVNLHNKEKRWKALGWSFKPQRGKFTRSVDVFILAFFGVSNPQREFQTPNGVNLHGTKARRLYAG